MEVNIGGRSVGTGHPALIIAEVSANHRGNLDVALRAIDAAAEAGADAVKFQHLRAEHIAADVPAEFEWKGQKDFKTFSEFYKKSELPYEWTPKLALRAKERDIMFLSTPFDKEAVDVLEPHVPAYKVASYEMSDDMLLGYIARKKKPVILSTGMAYLDEVKHALDVLRGGGSSEVIVLHCVSMYPPEPPDFNLHAIETIRRELNVPVGFSDHSLPGSNTATLGAIALSACVIERHITDSQTGGSRDDENSMTPEQFTYMVKQVRELETMLGTGIKTPVSRPEAGMDEMHERRTRRSLYAARDIPAGTPVTEDMVVTLRPVRGVEPKDFNLINGKKTKRDIKARAPITLNDFFPAQK